MARVTNDRGPGYKVDNSTGKRVREKINEMFAAISSLNSGAGDPTINTAFQPHIDTGSNLLKIRNGGNDGYITLGNINTSYLGLLPLSTGSATERTLTQPITHGYTSAFRLPVGTSAQRPTGGDLTAGQFRYNSTINSAEFYNGTEFIPAAVTDNLITNAKVNASAAIAATKLSFDHSATGGTARSIDSKFKDTISVKDFGAVGDGSTNDTTAIQNALDAGAGTANVYIPPGTYIVHDTILIPSNTYFYGAGEMTVIKMQDDIDVVRTLVLTGRRDQKRKNIVIEHMTLDFNRRRYTNADGTGRIGSDATNQNDTEAKPTDPRINDGTVIDNPPATLLVNTNLQGDNFQDFNSDTLCICFSENVLINNVKALNAYKHCIDTCAPKFRRSDTVLNDEGEYVATTTTPAIYDTVARNGQVVGANNTITVSLTGHGFDVDDEIFLRITGQAAHSILYKVTTVVDDDSFTVTTPQTATINSGTACVVIQDQGSKNVVIQNCYAEGAGDDNITTHHSSNILITGCESRNPSGHLVDGNSNCYEIDDGSRNVTISNCLGIGGCKGIQIKGHDYAPAPYNVTIDGLRLINCAEGIDLKHTGRSTLTLDSSSLGGGTITNPDHQIRNGDIAYSGGSPTAKNVTISNVQIIAPRGVVTNRQIRNPDQGTRLVKVARQIQLYAYENVVFTNIMIQDGSFDLAGDFFPAISGTNGTDTDAATDITEVVFVFGNAKNISFKNLAIMGFRNAIRGFRCTTSFGDHLAVDGFISQDGPLTAFEVTGNNANPAATGQLDNYFIIGNHQNDIHTNDDGSTRDAMGIRNTLSRFFIESHGGRVLGYKDNIFTSSTSVTTQEG